MKKISNDDIKEYNKVDDVNIMDDGVIYSNDDFNCKKALLYTSFRAV